MPKRKHDETFQVSSIDIIREGIASIDLEPPPPKRRRFSQSNLQTLSAQDRVLFQQIALELRKISLTKYSRISSKLFDRAKFLVGDEELKMEYNCNDPMYIQVQGAILRPESESKIKPPTILTSKLPKVFEVGTPPRVNIRQSFTPALVDMPSIKNVDPFSNSSLMEKLVMIPEKPNKFAPPPKPTASPVLKLSRPAASATPEQKEPETPPKLSAPEPKITEKTPAVNLLAHQSSSVLEDSESDEEDTPPIIYSSKSRTRTASTFAPPPPSLSRSLKRQDTMTPARTPESFFNADFSAPSRSVRGRSPSSSPERSPSPIGIPAHVSRSLSSESDGVRAEVLHPPNVVNIHAAIPAEITDKAGRWDMEIQSKRYQDLPSDKVLESSRWLDPLICEFFENGQLSSTEQIEKTFMLRRLERLIRKLKDDLARAKFLPFGGNVRYREFGGGLLWDAKNTTLDIAIDVNAVRSIENTKILQRFSQTLNDSERFAVKETILECQVPILKVDYIHFLDDGTPIEFHLHISMYESNKCNASAQRLKIAFDSFPNVKRVIFFIRELVSERKLVDAKERYPNKFTWTQLVMWAMRHQFGEEISDITQYTDGQLLSIMLHRLSHESVERKRGLNATTGGLFYAKRFRLQIVGKTKMDIAKGNYVRPSDEKMCECINFLRNLLGHISTLTSTPHFEYLTEISTFGDATFEPRVPKKREEADGKDEDLNNPEKIPEKKSRYADGKWNGKADENDDWLVDDMF